MFLRFNLLPDLHNYIIIIKFRNLKITNKLEGCEVICYIITFFFCYLIKKC